MPPLRARLAVGLFTGLLISGPAGAQAPTTAADAVMPGDGDVFIDIFYQEALLSSQRALHENGRLTLANPDEILMSLPPLSDPDELRADLAAPLPTFEQSPCRRRGARACAEASGQTLVLVYDRDLFRAELYLAPERLAQAAPTRKLLPPSRSGFSYQQRFDLATSGNFDDSGAINLRPLTVLAYRNARLFADGSLSDPGGEDLDQLEAQLDHRGWLYRGGLMRTGGSVFAGGRRFVGVAAGNQLETRLDYEAVFGNPLELLLDSESLVEVFRDGRLIHTERLGPGFARIDTRTFSEGSYQVQLRIIDSRTGSVREESRLFVKSTLLPPMDQTLWFAEAGELRPASAQIDPAEDPAYLNAGFGRRLHHRLGLVSSLGLSDGELRAESALSLISEPLRLRLAAGGRPREPLAISADASGRWQRLSYGVNYFRLAADSLSEQTLNERMSARIALRGPWRSLFTLRYARARGEERQWALGLRWPLFLRPDFRLVLSGDWAREGDQDRINVQLQFERPGRRLQSSVTAGYRKDPGNPRLGEAAIGGAQLTLRSLDRRREATAGIDLDGLQERLRLGGRYDGRHLQFDGELGDSTDDPFPATYRASLSTALVGTFNGATLAGSSANNAAVAVILNGSAQSAQPLQLLVDGIRRSELKPGQSVTLYLSPYRSYRLRLASDQAAWLWFDESEREVVLYPGNVEVLRWTVSPLLTVYGRVLDEAGEPLAGGRIVGAREAVHIGPDGYFQADVSADLGTLEIKTGTGECQVPLPQPDGDFLSLGTVRCTTAATP